MASLHLARVLSPVSPNFSELVKFSRTQDFHVDRVTDSKDGVRWGLLWLGLVCALPFAGGPNVMACEGFLELGHNLLDRY